MSSIASVVEALRPGHTSQDKEGCADRDTGSSSSSSSSSSHAPLAMGQQMVMGLPHKGPVVLGWRTYCSPSAAQAVQRWQERGGTGEANVHSPPCTSTPYHALCDVPSHQSYAEPHQLLSPAATDLVI